jgi:hypothetical protein
VSETQLVRSVLDALAARGIWSWRENSGLTVFGSMGGASRRVVRGAPKGTPDILGVLPGGRLFGIECKSAKGRQNPNQKAWEQRAAKHSVRYGVARSVSDALDLVDAWQSDR